MKHNEPEKQAPVKVAIVDDDPGCIRELKEMLGEEKDLEVVAEITNPCMAAEKIYRTGALLVFLDIQMPEKDGFGVLRDLKQEGYEPFMIFVTAYDHYAVQAIKNAAFDYLIKPVDKKELQISLQRFFEALEKEQRTNQYAELLESIDSGKKIRLNNSGGFIVLKPEEILFVEADWNYSKVYRARDSYETVTMNIGSVEKILPENSFLRINRSTIINLHYLTRVLRLARKCILEKDGDTFEFCIPLGRIREVERRL